MEYSKVIKDFLEYKGYFWSGDEVKKNAMGVIAYDNTLLTPIGHGHTTNYDMYVSDASFVLFNRSIAPVGPVFLEGDFSHEWTMFLLRRHPELKESALEELLKKNMCELDRCNVKLSALEKKYKEEKLKILNEKRDIEDKYDRQIEQIKDLLEEKIEM